MPDGGTAGSKDGRPGSLSGLARGWVSVAVAALLIAGQVGGILLATQSAAPRSDEVERSASESRQIVAELRAADPDGLAERAERNRAETEGLLSRFREAGDARDRSAWWLALPVWLVAVGCLVYGAYQIAEAVAKRRPGRRRREDAHSAATR